MLNIEERDLSELKICRKEEISISALFDFFGYHPSEYVYVLDEANLLVDIITKNDIEMVAQGKFPENYPSELAVEEGEIKNNFDVYRLFSTAVLTKRIAVVREGTLIKEYVNSNLASISFKQHKNLQALRYVTVFAEQIKKYLQEKIIKKIGILSDTRIFEFLKENLKGFECVHVTYNSCWEECDLVFNFLYDKEICLMKQNRECVHFYEFLENIVFCLICECCPKAQIYFCQVPEKDKLSCLTAREKENFAQSPKELVLDYEFLKEFCVNEENLNYNISLQYGDADRTFRLDNGFYEVLSNIDSSFIQVKDGVRRTIGAPSEADHCIHMIGSCIVQGAFVTDKYTIASLLQEKINELRNDIAVINRGVGGGNSIINDEVLILNTPVNSSDKIIWIAEFDNEKIKAIKDNKLNYIDLNDLFNRCKNEKTLFLDSPKHTNSIGNEIIANCLFDEIEFDNIRDNGQRKSYFERVDKQIERFANVDITSSKAKFFMRDLKKKKFENSESKRVGMVLINANPFSRGHRHLIDMALKTVDYLYIFVLYENASYFSALDRLHMIKAGTKDLKNVQIIQSSNLIFSQQGFPDYFLKSQIDELNENTEWETIILARDICPMLNIKYRFMGEEEPKSVTDLYNKLVNRINNDYGIETVIIPRIKNEENATISASLIRNYFKNDNVEALKNLVCSENYSYLCELHKIMREQDSNAKKISIEPCGEASLTRLPTSTLF